MGAQLSKRRKKRLIKKLIYKKYVQTLDIDDGGAAAAAADEDESVDLEIDKSVDLEMDGFYEDVDNGSCSAATLANDVDDSEKEDLYMLPPAHDDDYLSLDEFQRNESVRRSHTSNDSAFSDRSTGSSTCNSSASNTRRKEPFRTRTRRKNKLKHHHKDTTAVKKYASCNIPVGSDRYVHDCKKWTCSNKCKHPEQLRNVGGAWRKYCVDPSDYIPQMVEIFRSQLEGSIKVRELICYFPFIDDRAEILEQNAARGVSCLLDRILESKEKGKWTTFLNALKTVGYQYIANLLTGETEVNDTIQRDMVKIFEPDIIDRMDTSEFLDHLYQAGVISTMDKEEIQREANNRGQIAANLMMIDRIPRKLENWYSVFIETMKKCGMGDVADSFESSEISIHDDVTKSSCKSSGPTASSCTCGSSVAIGVLPAHRKRDVTKLHTDSDDDDYIHPTAEEERPSPISISIRHLPLPPVPRLPQSPRLPRLPLIPVDKTAAEPASIISKLKAQKKAIRKQIDEKKFEKMLREHVQLLQLELEELTAEAASQSCVNNTTVLREGSDNETSSSAGLHPDTAIAADMTCANDLLNQENDIPEISDDDITQVKQALTDATAVNADINDVPELHAIHADNEALTGTIHEHVDDAVQPGEQSDTTEGTYQRIVDCMKQELLEALTVHISKEIEKNIQPVLLNMKNLKMLPIPEEYMDTSDEKYTTVVRRTMKGPTAHMRARRLDSGMESDYSAMSYTDVAYI